MILWQQLGSKANRKSNNKHDKEGTTINSWSGVFKEALHRPNIYFSACARAKKYLFGNLIANTRTRAATSSKITKTWQQE
jgi:hypothetical protein